MKRTLILLISLLLAPLADVLPAADAVANGAAPPEVLAPDELALVRELATATLETCGVAPGAIARGKTNTLGFRAITPGGYPAIWIQDFTMNFSSGLIAREDGLQHFQLILEKQNGPEPRDLGRQVVIPAHAIPDHINVDGAPVFFPGTYDPFANMNGDWGFRPPSNNQFDVIWLAHMLARSGDAKALLSREVGGRTVYERLKLAFAVPEIDPATQLVRTTAARRSVGFIFYDAIEMTGDLLMASLIRYRAALHLAWLATKMDQPEDAKHYADVAQQIRSHILPVFADTDGTHGGWLKASNGISGQSEVWGSIYAIYIGAVEGEGRAGLLRTITAALAKPGEIEFEGALRHVPLSGDASPTTMWEKTRCPKNRYENGAYWHIPVGWLLTILQPGHPELAQTVKRHWLGHLHAQQGKVWECIGWDGQANKNPSYGTSIALPLGVLSRGELRSDRLLAPLAALHAATPTSWENNSAMQWAQSNVFAEQAKLPFSFVLGGKSSGELLRDWKRTDSARELDTQRRELTRTWMDAATGLQVRLVATEYAGHPVAEWTVWLKNTGKANTPIIEDIQGLDFTFEREKKGEFVLHGIRGDTCVAESFRPFSLKLGPDAVKRCSPPVAGDKVSGKSSDGPDGWPYWDLQKPGGGIILAVGWPGQWEATFTRDHERSLRVKAGQQLTHLVLKPGEEIRTPSITLLFWQGDDVVRAQNLWRSWYLAHVLPRIEGTPQPPTRAVWVDGTLASWSSVQAYLDAGIKADICWRDAGGAKTWYPSSDGPFTDKKAWLNTGTWEVDTTKYPQGFKPFSDKARENGMQFLLWFEPERVGDPNSWLGKNHPEWLMPGNSAGSVLNLGDPNALKWLIEHIDGMVKLQGLDWYREDLNGGNYGTAWRKHDAPDRQGITENLYVQGHLTLWDELRRRNPKLRIDSCASGGRRNDLETMRRSVPLLRSDWSVTAFAKEPLQLEGNQCQTFGLSSWLPWQGAGVPFFTERYAVRSYYLTQFGMISAGDWTKDKQKRADTIRSYGEIGRISHLMLGDYYPLTPYSLDKTSWIAWQFHRTDLNEGVVQAFRRPDATSEMLTVKLRGLYPQQRYEIENLDGGKEVRTGAELMRGLDITLREKPAAAVLVLKTIP